MTTHRTDASRTSRRGLAGRILPVLALLGLLVAVTGCGILSSSGDTKENGADVGACANISGSSFDAKFDEVDCGDGAAWVVVAKGEKCDTSETTYTETINGDESVQLCLWHNAEAGECIKDFDSASTPATKVDCADVKGDLSAAKVTVAADDAKAKCKKKTDVALVNKLRNKVICFQPIA